MSVIKATSGRREDTALLQAAFDGNVEGVRRALDAGASVDCRPTVNGQTPLILAAQRGHVAALEQLIGRGANLEAATSRGWTALHWAATKGHAAAAELLVVCGASLAAVDGVGKTPLQVARDCGKAEVAAILEVLSDLKKEVQEQKSLLEYLQEDVELLDKKPAFFVHYKVVEAPTTTEEVEKAAEELVLRDATEHGTPLARAQSFIDALRFANAPPKPTTPETQYLSDIGFYANWLWSRDEALLCDGGLRRPFYKMLTQASRNGTSMRSSILLQKALNDILVDRLSKNAWPKAPSWLATHTTYRGAGIPWVQLAFWEKLKTQKLEERRKYRTPFPLASSVERHVAEDFLSRVPSSLAKVLFVLKWASAVNPCLNAGYLAHISAMGAEEEEILLTTYSVLSVEATEDAPAGSPWDKVITVKVARDNSKERENMRVPEWH